jgi:tRNA pseudouridine55 synthase
MNGMFNILKPSGMSSNAVLSKIKKRFNIKKVGHLGTLDPLATGVLPVAVGKATKLFDYFLKKNKVYKAVFTFGKLTNTLDSEGTVINTSEHIPSKADIQKVLSNMTGQIDQIPPNFSAKNVNGKRAYELARQDKEFTLPPKTVNIYSFDLLEQVDKNSYLFEISCSSGTYIRSIARDLGKLLNTYAYMSALVRVKSGIFDISNSITMEELLQENSQKQLINFEELLTGFEKINLDDKYYNDLVNGIKIETDITKNKEFLLYCKNELFGIAYNLNGYLKIKVNLKIYNN